MTKIAVIRLKGSIGLQRPVKETFKMLKLYKVNYCTILPKSKNMIGMLDRIKDFATWGEIDTDTTKELLILRGRLPSNKSLTPDYIHEKTGLTAEAFAKEIAEGGKALKDIPGLKPFFRLKPPTGGFEKKGAKRPYSLGGSSGYRKDHINSLIKRML